MALTMDTDADPFEVARLQLQRLREMHQLTQEDLASILGLHQARVSDRLGGRSKLTIADIHRAARYFGVSPAVFFEMPEVLPTRRRIARTPGTIKMNWGPIRSETLLAA